MLEVKEKLKNIWVKKRAGRRRPTVSNGRV
jgi:hypothetical protein